MTFSYWSFCTWTVVLLRWGGIVPLFAGRNPYLPSVISGSSVDECSKSRAWLPSDLRNALKWSSALGRRCSKTHWEMGAASEKPLPKKRKEILTILDHCPRSISCRKGCWEELQIQCAVPSPISELVASLTSSFILFFQGRESELTFFKYFLFSFVLVFLRQGVTRQP